MYSDEEFLPLSGIQHFSFCKRQWALIHIDKRWKDNYLTASGQVMHNRAHDESIRERRGALLVVRGLFVRSFSLGISGVCDVVEFRRDDSLGVSLAGEVGRWLPSPVEYKRGCEKANDCDRLQVTAQALCLEEMLGCEILQGALFYKQTQSRETVEITSELRDSVRDMTDEMHRLFNRRYIPHVRQKKHCKACSLADECIPSIQRRSAIAYINETMGWDK